MKAQATLELLVVFAATLAIITILSLAILAQKAGAEDRTAELGRIAAVEGAARAVEASCAGSGAGGMGLDFYDEDVYYRVEDGLFHVSYAGRTIEGRGVFADDGSEPV